MFCSNCGTKLDDDSFFCSECGVRINKIPVPDTETYSWVMLLTNHGTEAATSQSIREAISTALQNEDEYAKLSPIISGKNTFSLIAYTPYAESGELNVQIIKGERGEKYESCYEKEGFSLEDVCKIFLNYAKTRVLPTNYSVWSQL